MARDVSSRVLMSAALAALLLGPAVSRADETCMSPYMPKITGQEDYVYVWTLGIEGVGDGSDKLVTIGANPADAAHYGKVLSSVPVGGRHEAHHAGFADDRRYLWAGGLDDGGVGLPRPQAHTDARRPGRPARDPLGAPAAPQLRPHRGRPDLQDLARRAEGRRHLRGKRGRRHRQPEGHPVPGRHQPLG